MKRMLGLLAGFLALSAAPSWADHTGDITEYLNHQAGTITGSVMSSSPQSVVLTPDAGQQQTFAIDSKSVVPNDMPAGQRVRVQFRLLDSGTYHAQRVTPIQTWEEDYTTTPMRTEVGSSTTEPATAMETREYHSNEPIAHDYTKSTSRTTSSETYNTQDQATGSETTQREATGSATTEEDRLPTTASSLPLIALMAFLTLALSGALWLRRRLRRA